MEEATKPAQIKETITQRERAGLTDVLRAVATEVDGFCVYKDGYSDKRVLAEWGASIKWKENPSINIVQGQRKAILGDLRVPKPVSVAEAMQAQLERLLALETSLIERIRVVEVRELALELWASKRPVQPYTLEMARV